MAQIQVIGQEKKQGNGEKSTQSYYDIRNLLQRQNQVDTSSHLKKIDVVGSNREKGFVLDCTKYSRQERYNYNPLSDQNMKVFFSNPRTRFILMDHNILPPNIEYLQKKNSPTNYRQVLNSSMNNAAEKEPEIRQSLPPLKTHNRIQLEKDNKSSPKKEQHLLDKSLLKAEAISNNYSTSNKTSKAYDIVSPLNKQKLSLTKNSSSKKTKTNPNSYRSNNEGLTEREVVSHLPAIPNRGRVDTNTDCIGRQTFSDFMKAQKAKYQLTKTNHDHINEDQIQ